MSSTRARDEFMHWSGRYGLPVYFAEKILRAAGDVQRAAEVDCSISDEKTRAYWDVRDARARAKIKTILDEHETCNGGKWSASFSGDPRGNCVKLRTETGGARLRPGSPNVVEWGVPARGFSASEMERLTRFADRFATFGPVTVGKVAK